MQYTLKTLAAAAALAVVGVANAAPVTTATGGTSTIAGNDLTLTGGTGALSFSAGLIDALNASRTSVTEVAPATVVEGYVYDPDLEEDVRVSSTATAPIASVTQESTTGAVLAVATSGGAALTATKASGISFGGTLTVTNISVDLTNKAVYASITGNFTGAATGVAGSSGGAITTINNFHVWDYASISGLTTVTTGGTYANTISGLTITTDAQNHFISALRLQTQGINALKAVTDFGTINSSITVTAVPEPSTYAMVIAGLALVGVAARRARKA